MGQWVSFLDGSYGSWVDALSPSAMFVYVWGRLPHKSTCETAFSTLQAARLLNAWQAGGRSRLHGAVLLNGLVCVALNVRAILGFGLGLGSGIRSELTVRSFCRFRFAVCMDCSGTGSIGLVRIEYPYESTVPYEQPVRYRTSIPGIWISINYLCIVVSMDHWWRHQLS